MTATDKSKRSFFKTVAAAVGFVAAAGFVSKLLPGRASSLQAINSNSANDVRLQKKAWSQKQMVVMSENDKERMLAEIIDSHSNYRT